MAKNSPSPSELLGWCENARKRLTEAVDAIGISRAKREVNVLRLAREADGKARKLLSAEIIATLPVAPVFFFHPGEGTITTAALDQLIGWCRGQGPTTTDISFGPAPFRNWNSSRPWHRRCWEALRDNFLSASRNYPDVRWQMAEAPFGKQLLQDLRGSELPSRGRRLESGAPPVRSLLIESLSHGWAVEVSRRANDRPSAGYAIGADPGPESALTEFDHWMLTAGYLLTPEITAACTEGELPFDPKPKQAWIALVWHLTRKACPVVGETNVRRDGKPNVYVDQMTTDPFAASAEAIDALLGRPAVVPFIDGLPEIKLSGVISLLNLLTRMQMPEQQEWCDNDPDVERLRGLLPEVLIGQPFTHETIRSLMAWLRRHGLEKEQAKHLPLAEAVVMLRHYVDSREERAPGGLSATVSRLNGTSHCSFDYEDEQILLKLKELSPKRCTNNMLHFCTRISEKTVAQRVNRLISQGLVHRPAGDRGGCTLSNLGVATCQRLKATS